MRCASRPWGGRLGIAVAVAVACGGGTARAQYYWATTGTGLWSDGVNWSNDATSGGTTGVVPSSSQTATFNQSSVNGATTVELNATTNIGSMVFANTGATVIRSATAGLQLLQPAAGQSLTVNAGAGPVTFGDGANAVNLRIRSWTVTNNSTSLLTFANDIILYEDVTPTFGGPGDIVIRGRIDSERSYPNMTKSGAGTLFLTGSGTRLNNLSISNGTLEISGTGSIGNVTSGGNTPAFGPRFTGNFSNAAAFLYASSANQYLANLSGTGSLTVAAAGMLTLQSAAYTGPTTITSGTLNYAGGTLGTSGIVNDGVLLFSSNVTVPSLISGTGRVVNNGINTATITGSNVFTGPLEIWSGTVALNFAASTAPLSDMLAANAAVSLGSNVGDATAALPTVSPGLTLTGSAGLANSQSLAGLTVNDGYATVTATAPASGSVTLSVGDLRRSAGSGGGVVFAPSATGTVSITTTTGNTNGIIGPWAFVRTSSTLDWASSAASGTTPGAITPYTSYLPNAFASGSNTNLTAAFTAPANAETNSLRIAAGNNTAFTLAGTATIASGGVLIQTGNSLSLNGGVLRGSPTNGLQITTNAAGGFTINSQIVDNGGTAGLTFASLGGGPLTLAGNNTYTGRTTLLGGIYATSAETGTSGPLGVGGPIEFVMGNALYYSTPRNTFDYSTRFTTAANQSYGVNVAQNLDVTWNHDLGDASGGRLTVTTLGNLTLSGSNSFPNGVQVRGPYDTQRRRIGSLTLGSGNAVGSAGVIALESWSNFLSKLRYTSASAGLDIGSRLGGNSNVWAIVDTNGQDVTWETSVNLEFGSSLYKTGAGQLTLTGSNRSAGGGLVVAGGTLTLDSAVNATTMNNQPITGYGVGTFQYRGAADLARSQTLNGLRLTMGMLTVAVDNVGTTTTLDFSGGSSGVITRTTSGGGIGSVGNLGTHGTVDFRAINGTFGTTAIIKTSAGQTLTNGIIGPWATVNGSDWATQSGGTIQSLSAYAEPIEPTIADDPTANVRLSLGGTYALAAATTGAYTLLQAGTSATTISLPSQALQTAGVMVAGGAGPLTIGDTPGSGTLQADSAGGEIILSNFGSGPLTVNSVIADNASASRLTISGNGTVVLTASNTITGTTTVQGGTLRIGNGDTTGSLGTTAGVYMAPGGTLVFDRTDDYGGTQTYRVLGSAYGDDYTGGVIIRGGNLTLTPSAANWYSGFTQLLGGTVTIGQTDALGVYGDVTFGGGVLRYGSGVTTDLSWRIAGSTSAIVVDTNGQSPTWNFSVAASNLAGLTKNGTGTLTLNNVNAYGGVTNVNAGTLQAAAQSVPGDIVNNSAVVFNNDWWLGVGGTYAGVISGLGTVSVTGTTLAPITLSGTSTYATVPVVQQGRLDIGWMAPAGQPSPLGTSGTVSLGTTGIGGLLGYSGGSDLTFDRIVNLPGTTVGGGLAADGAGAFVVTSNLSVTGVGSKTFTLTGSGTAANEMAGLIVNYDGSRLTSLAKTGDGLWRLTAANTFTGKTSIAGGTLVVDTLSDAGVAGPLGAPTTAANTLIDLGSTAAPAVLRYSGSLAASTNRGIRLTGTGTLEAAGSAPVTFATVTGSAGENTLVLAGTSTAANSLGAVSDALGGVTNVIKDGLGSWTLSAASGFTGRLTVKQGTIVAAAGVGQTGDGVFGGGDAQLPLVGDSADGATGRAAVLLADNVLIDRGLVVAPLGDAATQEAVLGTVATSGTFGSAMSIRLGRDLTLQAADGGTVVFANAWEDLSSGTLPAVAFNVGSAGNAGTVALNRFLPESITAVNVRRGTLRLNGGNDTIGVATPVSLGETGAGGTLDLNGTEQFLASLAFAGTASGVSDLLGGGSLGLSNSGSAAAVSVAGTGHAIAVPVFLEDAATFTVATGGRLAISSVIADGQVAGQGLTKAGPGILELTGANTFTGTTTVSAGTLVVNGSLAQGALSVAAGATLMGSGTVGGAATIFGIHAPGNSPGIETFAGNLTYSGGSSEVIWELWGNTDSNSPTVAFDQIVVGGNLDFAGATSLQLAFSGTGSAVDWADPFWASEQTWTLHDVTGTTSGFSNLTLAGGPSSWFDSNNQSLASVRPQGSFSVLQQEEDVTIAYVPEPATLALAACGLALGLAAASNRSRRSTVNPDGRRRAP